MVSTFISLLDIQSWWEIPCIAHFCSLFSSAFDLPDIDIEDLESALLTDGTEETVGLLPELIVRILKGCDLLKSNRDEITTSNYQMFLRRFLRHQCRENNIKNYFDADTDFSSLPVRNKLLILHSLCHFRLESADVCYKFNNLEADSLRVEPLGFDSKNSGYWYFFGTRLYREDIKPNSKDTIWQVICFTEEDWQNLATKLKTCKTKKGRALLKILEENFLPKLPQLFLEREKLRRRKLFQNRNSARIRAADIKYKDLHEKQDLERIEREKYEEQLKLAEATNKKRRRSRSESSGSGISTYASSVRPSLNSSDFLCKREKFCLSPDLGASSLSPPPASLIHNHTPLFPPTPSQSPPLEKCLKTFNDVAEYETQQENIEVDKISHNDLLHINATVNESKIFSGINNHSTPSDINLKDQRESNFTPESFLKSDIKSYNSSNYCGYSDDYDDAISLVSFDEDKENLICYKRSDTESDTSIDYYSNSPAYCSISGIKTTVDSKFEEKINSMAPITSSTTVKLPGRQTNNSLSSISENIFLPTLDTISSTKKNTKTNKTGKKEAKEAKSKSIKTEKLEKSDKKNKNTSNEKLDKKSEKKEMELDYSLKKKKARSSDSQNQPSLTKKSSQTLPPPKLLPSLAITSYMSTPTSNSYFNSTNNSFLSFTETDEVLQIGMHKVLVYVKNHRDAWPFMDPVEEDIAPRYYSIIRRPMDLLKMEDKLDNGEYKKFSEFRNDFKLIVNNCRLYNGQNNEYTEMVNNLQEAFDKATKKYFDNLSDEEDELGYPDSKLNVFREKYFNKNSINDEDIEKASNIVQNVEKDNKEQNSGDSDEDDNKVECKNKTTKRKHKDKDKRRKKKIKLEEVNSIPNDDTEEEEDIEDGKKSKKQEQVFQYDNTGDELDTFQNNLKNKNKKIKKITEINKSKKKADSKLKDKDKYRKLKEDHSCKDNKHKNKTKTNDEKHKEIIIKKHGKKAHNKIKNHKGTKDTKQHCDDNESDIEHSEEDNAENLSHTDNQNTNNENDDIYNFDESNIIDDNFEMESKNKSRKHGIKLNKKSEKTSKNKKGKENQNKIKDKGKSVKKPEIVYESRTKKKADSKIKKEKCNTKYSDEPESNSENSEPDDNDEKATFFSDSSRSPTPNFKVDLHKKYANTLTPTKSASVERNFSNDEDDGNDNSNKDDIEKIDNHEDVENENSTVDGGDTEDEYNEGNKKNQKKNSQRRNKDLNKKKDISKSGSGHKSKGTEITSNQKSKATTKKLKSKFKGTTYPAAKPKKLPFNKSKSKMNKISEKRHLSKNKNEDDQVMEDVMPNQDQSLRSRSQSPNTSDLNEKLIKHKTKSQQHSNKVKPENKNQNNQNIKLKSRKEETSESEAETSDEEENISLNEKDVNVDVPLFLDKYDLIKQRRRCAALNSKKEEDKNKKLGKPNNKLKKCVGKNKATSNKSKEKTQKLKENTEKNKVKNDKNKDRKNIIDEIHDSVNCSEKNQSEKEVLENVTGKNSVEKSSSIQIEKNNKKSQNDTGKTKHLKLQNSLNVTSEVKDTRNKEPKLKENKQREIKTLKKKESGHLDNKLSENTNEKNPITGSSIQNKKTHLKKQQQILETLPSSLSNTSNLLNKKKGKNALGIAPPVAIVAPTQSLTNTSLIKSDSVANKTTNMEALELETEQTLKDINRWLEHTPRFSEFSSASNSPNRYNLLDDFDAVAAKLDPADFRRPIDAINTSTVSGSAMPTAKVDVDSKLTENYEEMKKPANDNKLITDLIPATVMSNKGCLLNNKDSDLQTINGTNLGTSSNTGLISTVGSALPINTKSKEPNSTQLLPHPPPPPPHIKNQLQKEAKRKTLKEKLTGASRRKDLLRTIDRLHPGKSKGNLLTNVHNTNKPEELFPLGAASKIKEIKNSLVVETDESAPKLSLGSVLNTSGFGLGQLHNFGDEIASNEFKISEAITSNEDVENIKKCETIDEKTEKNEKENEIIIEKSVLEDIEKDDKPFQSKKEETQCKNEVKSEDGKSSSATPNLSAWFKAFGAPKKTKKSDEEEDKKKQESAELINPTQNASEDSPTSPCKNLKSPTESGPDNFSLPAPRQRKASTGSTVSERSSYSHDPDSPRIGIDDRFGPYPGPYASPIGASPIMVSPKPDEISKPSSPYPLNGTIKVGFYQDTTTKSSPEKSCSPRELPSPAYPQYSQHIYSANSPNINTNTDITSTATTSFGAGNNQTNNTIANGSTNYHSSSDNKKSSSSSSFSPRSPVQPPTPTLYEQYKQPQSQESDYNSSMSPSTNPNSPYQQPQSSPYQHNSSSPYHQSSNPNSPYQQPHSPFSNQQGQSGQGPPSSGPPSVGSMHIVTNSPNHPNGESPTGQNSPYQQQLNSPYQHSGHSSPYNQSHNPTSPYQQSSSPAHSSVPAQTQQSPQINTQTKTNFAHSPIPNLETATSVLEKQQHKIQKSENDNIYEVNDLRSDEGNLKPIGNHNTDSQNQKSQMQAPVVQQTNLPERQSNQSQHHSSQSQAQTQQHSSQLINQSINQQSSHYNTAQTQVQNQNEATRNAYESTTLVSNAGLNQAMDRISNLSSSQVSQTNSMTDKTNLDLQQQYSKYPQYTISSNTDKSTNQCDDFVSDLSLQIVSKQNNINLSNAPQQPSQQSLQKQQNQQQLHHSLQQQQSQNLHQSTHNIQPPQSQQQIQQQNSSHNLQSQQPQHQIKQNYESASTAINVGYAQPNTNVNDIKDLKGDDKQLQLSQRQPPQQHQQQHPHHEQTQPSQQQSLYDSAALNKHQQMFDGFITSMAAGKNIGFNKSLDITSSKAYEVLNKAAMGFPNSLVQAAAAVAISNKDNLQQHQTIAPSHISQQPKSEALTNLYSQSLTQINNNNRINLSHQQSQSHQTQQQSQQTQQQRQQQQQHQSQRSQQTQQQQIAINQQSSAIPLYGGSKSAQTNVSNAGISYGSQNISQRNENSSSELMSNAMNRNLDLSNYKTSSTYQNSNNIIDHTMRHHSTLTQIMDDSNMLGLQNNNSNTIATSYYDKNMPPAAHMFSKNLPQQLYQNSSALYGGRDQQNLPPPGNYVPQSNQSTSNTTNMNSQLEQISSGPSNDQKPNKRNKKKKAIEIANLNQSAISHQQSSSNIQQQPQNLQLQQHQQQDQQQMLNNSPQNVSNTSGNNIPQNVTAAHQGFQLYAGLKTAAAVVAASTSTNQAISSSSNASSTDASAISLKTAAAAASMVPGSAFNFGPSPTGLPLPGGLYGDNSTYLEEFRNANPYYIPPTHHRVPPETTNNPNQTSGSEKSQSSTINSNNSPTVAVAAAAAASPYHQFLTAAAHPATQRGSYPFMNSPQLDPNSPLYTQYLRPDEFRARMMQNLSQTLLPPGAAAGYPQTGYRPTLGMPKPYDMNNRQPWF